MMSNLRTDLIDRLTEMPARGLMVGGRAKIVADEVIDWLMPVIDQAISELEAR